MLIMELVSRLLRVLVRVYFPIDTGRENENVKRALELVVSASKQILTGTS